MLAESKSMARVVLFGQTVVFFFKQKTAYEMPKCGVQTCALPISRHWPGSLSRERPEAEKFLSVISSLAAGCQRQSRNRHPTGAALVEYAVPPRATASGYHARKIGRASCRDGGRRRVGAIAVRTVG